MTRFPKLYALLTGIWSARSQPLEDAQERRSNTMRLLREAEDRKDTRDIHKYQTLLLADTTSELKANCAQRWRAT